MNAGFASLGQAATVEGVVLLAALAATVAFRLATGRIPLHGLLRDKRDGGFSATRAQALLATFGLAGTLLRALSATESPPRLDLGADPTLLLAAFGGAHGLYLYAKSTSAPRATPAPP